MKIYVASSWRNSYQQQVVSRLREMGHDVYDFRGPGDGWGNNGDGPGGFGWHKLDPGWEGWITDVDSYIQALDRPRALEGFNRDMDALRMADCCVMVNPCGQDAHAEMGWAAGAGKLVAIYCPEIRGPDLMVKMASLVTNKWIEVELYLSKVSTPAGPIAG